MIAIPLKSQNDYTELRFTLRSINKFLPSHEVVIVGDDLPEWITNVTQIKVSDIPGRKQLTIKKKTWAALEYAKEIIYFPDDVYLLRPYEKQYYTAGTLKNVGESGAKILIEELQKLNKPINNYDCHSPIIYERSKFEALQQFSGEVVVKSAYGNFWEIPAVHMADVKINKQFRPDQIRNLIKGRPYFSSGFNGIQSCLPIFGELYPTKSIYEL